MEKDYFRDRPVEATLIDSIKPGTEVYICTKHMQPYADKLEHLARGYVIKTLTRHNHPRGIKVSIKQVYNGVEMIGRVVYIVKDGLILTKDGLKGEEEVNT